jgi:hypothetical protein
MFLVCLVGGPAAMIAGDQSPADRAELRKAQHELRSQDVQRRVDGVSRLRTIADVEAAKVIVLLGLADSATEVRRLAYRTLFAWKDDRQIAPFLLKALNKESRAKKQGTSLFVPVAAVLLASELPDTKRDLTKFLGIYAASPEGKAALIAVADELAAQAEQSSDDQSADDESSLASLRPMTELKCFADSFAVRRAVVQAIARIRRPEAIDLLLALLPKLDGEVRGDVLRRLAAVAGQWLGSDPKAWIAWWQKNKKGFKFPPESHNSLSSAELARGPASFYGLAILARRAVFVIDISGSMAGQRLAAAQKELISAIDGLPEDASFNMVAFSDRAIIWRKSLVAASSQSKQAADKWVYSLRAGGHTAAYDALEAAFGFDAEAVYFLSDGQPNAGKIPMPLAIIAAVTQTNHTRRISIYTIGIIPGLAGSPLEEFMTQLAAKNFGLYRRVSK